MSQASFSPFDLVPGKLIAGRFLIEVPSRQSGLAVVFEVRDQKREADCELSVFPAALFESASDILNKV